LDATYTPSTTRADAAANDVEPELRRIAELFDEMLEAFEDEDPVANANAVQTSCLSFAVVSASAAYLRRRGQPAGSSAP
jgi:hypothetical protein